MSKRYRVTLTEEERLALQKQVSSGKAAARKLTHARILLLADDSVAGSGRTDEQSQEALGGGVRPRERVRQRLVEEGLAAAWPPRPRPRLRGKLEGAVEARLLALAKSDPPVGRNRWTLRLLADQLVELKYVPRVSHESIRQALKKTI
jgi:hypothetical protein